MFYIIYYVLLFAIWNKLPTYLSAKTHREFLDNHKDIIEAVYQGSLSNAMQMEIGCYDSGVE